MDPYYQRDSITILHGDCRHLLPSLTADLLLTDPPYGIRAARKSGFGAGRKNPATTGITKGYLVLTRDYGDSTWDDCQPSSWLST